MTRDGLCTLFPSESMRALETMCRERDGFSRRCFRFLPAAVLPSLEKSFSNAARILTSLYCSRYSPRCTALVKVWSPSVGALVASLKEVRAEPAAAPARQSRHDPHPSPPALTQHTRRICQSGQSCACSPTRPRTRLRSRRLSRPRASCSAPRSSRTCWCAPAPRRPQRARRRRNERLARAPTGVPGPASDSCPSASEPSGRRSRRAPRGGGRVVGRPPRPRGLQRAARAPVHPRASAAAGRGVWGAATAPSRSSRVISLSHHHNEIYQLTPVAPPAGRTSGSAPPERRSPSAPPPQPPESGGGGGGGGVVRRE